MVLLQQAIDVEKSTGRPAGATRSPGRGARLTCPNATSPFDDPFADLFGKLPDPRERMAAAGAAAAPEPPGASATGAGAARPRMPSGAASGRSRPPRSARCEQAAPQTVGPPRRSPCRHGATPVPHALRAETVRAAAPVPRRSSRGPALERVPHAAARRARTAVRDGDLEDLFAGSSTTDDLGAPPPPPKRRKRRIGGWIALVIVLALLGGIAAGGLWVWNTYEDKIRDVMGWDEPKDYEAGLANGEVLVTIASGDTGRPISQSAVRRRRHQDARGASTTTSIEHRRRTRRSTRASTGCRSR